MRSATSNGVIDVQEQTSVTTRKNIPLDIDAGYSGKVSVGSNERQ